MVRARLTREQTMMNYNILATEASRKLLKCRVQLAMDNRPQCIPDLWEKLTSLGYTVDSIQTPDGDTPKSERVKALEEKKKAVRDQKGHVKREGDDDEQEIVDAIGEKYVQLGQLTPSMLMNKIFSVLEPAVLSVANMKKVEKQMGKAGFVQLLEFMTGVGGDEEITKRCFRQVAADLHVRALARERRALTLELPPDWETQGLFQLEIRGDSLMVFLRYGTAQCKELSSKDVGDWPKEHVFVARNWSEERAELKCKALPKDQGIPLKAFFNFCVHVEGEDSSTQDSRRPNLKRALSYFGSASGCSGSSGSAQKLLRTDAAATEMGTSPDKAKDQGEEERAIGKEKEDEREQPLQMKEEPQEDEGKEKQGEPEEKDDEGKAEQDEGKAEQREETQHFFDEASVDLGKLGEGQLLMDVE